MFFERPHMKNNSELLITAIQAALEAGELLQKGFGTSFEIGFKPGKYNLVTEYDKASEQLIFSCLLDRFPNHGFIGEEQGKTRHGDVMWIVDPLDGTVNFAHGVPVFCVSIAAAVENEIVISCIYQPMSDELFWAEKGKGAFLNGKQLHVTKQNSLDAGLLATGFPYNVNEDPLHCIETFTKLLRQGVHFRRMGSAAMDLASVASGRFDAYFEVSLQPWDYAGGKLLVEEAGGAVTQYDGSPCDVTKATTILATNGVLHPFMQELLK